MVTQARGRNQRKHKMKVAHVGHREAARKEAPVRRAWEAAAVERASRMGRRQMARRMGRRQ